MKKIITILILLTLFIPIIGRADSYLIKKYDINISFPEDWEVLTSDNLKNNLFWEITGTYYFHLGF